MKLSMLFAAVVLALSVANAAEPAGQQKTVSPQVVTAQQELAAIQRLCDLARYANRMDADNICPYFVEKYREATARAEVKPKTN